jgi:spermidine synthase
VYEAVWLRLAMARFGVTTALVSIVLSMFMAGLGLVSWRVGVFVRRGIPASTALRLYSLAELLIGFSALLVPWELKLGRLVLQNMSGSATWQSSSYYLLSGVWIAITLIPWCTCMGSTFPLLMAAIRQTIPTERSFSYLYVANVLGAFLGTLVSAFVLIELLGFQGTLYVAAGLNVLLALLAFRISLAVASSDSTATATAARSTGQKLYGLPENSILYILFTTGLVSMGMEVIWIHQFTPYLGKVVYAFAGILAVYLLATLWGSQDYRSWARSHSLGERAPTWTRLALFAVIPLATADPLFALRIGGVELGGLHLSAIVLFCGYAGFLTPLLVDSWSLGDPDRAGKAYAVNVLGSILGPLVAGFWLLPWLGERWSLVALSIPLFGLAVLITFRKSLGDVVPTRSRLSPKLKYVLATVTAIILVNASHDYEKKYAQREVRGDYTATVIATGSGFERRLFVNGVGMTILTPSTKYMSHLPLAQVRHGMVEKTPNPCRMSSGNSWVYTTFAVELETLR